MKCLAKKLSVIALIIGGAAIPSNLSQAGETASEAQQKCLELTRIAADSTVSLPQTKNGGDCISECVRHHAAARRLSVPRSEQRVPGELIYLQTG
jgi:hypothetical protein